MSRVIDCPSCSRRLRVPEELAGARVKCPTCGEQFAAPGTTPNRPTPRPPDPPATPRPTDPTLPSPGEVRLNLSLDDIPPRPAPAADPPLPDEEPPPIPRRRTTATDQRPCPYCGEPISRRAVYCPHCDEELDREGDDRPWERKGRFGVRRDLEPHRGNLVLVLGILSIVCGALFFCYVSWIPGLPLGIIAWVMGGRDLKKMQAQLMDPDGRGATQGGWICGIIGTILNGLVTLLCIGMLGMIGLTAFQAQKTPPPPPPGRTPQPGKFLGPGVPLRVQDYLPGVCSPAATRGTLLR